MIHTTISLDEEIKKISELKAKKQNMSLSLVLRILLTDYATGKIEIGTRVVEEKDDNYSPLFENANEGIKWLHSNEARKFAQGKVC